MGLLDEAIRAVKGPAEENAEAKSASVTELQSMVIVEFARRFGVAETEITCKPISAVKAVVFVDGMEFSADATDLRLNIEGAVIVFMLRLRCPSCKMIYRTVVVNSLPDIGAAVSRKSRHKCKVVEGATEGGNDSGAEDAEGGNDAAVAVD